MANRVLWYRILQLFCFLYENWKKLHILLDYLYRVINEKLFHMIIWLVEFIVRLQINLNMKKDYYLKEYVEHRYKCYGSG